MVTMKHWYMRSSHSHEVCQISPFPQFYGYSASYDSHRVSQLGSIVMYFLRTSVNLNKVCSYQLVWGLPVGAEQGGENRGQLQDLLSLCQSKHPFLGTLGPHIFTGVKPNGHLPEDDFKPPSKLLATTPPTITSAYVTPSLTESVTLKSFPWQFDSISSSVGMSPIVKLPSSRMVECWLC